MIRSNFYLNAVSTKEEVNPHIWQISIIKDNYD